MKRFLSPKRGLIVLVCLLVAGAVIGFGAAKADKTNPVKKNIPKLTQEGYTLVAPINSKNAYLVDNKGKTVHQWATGYTPGVETRLLENGMLLRTTFDERKKFGLTGAGGGVQLIDWDGNVKWEYKYVADNYIQHHDATVMPNGHILMLAWVKNPRAAAEAAGVKAENIDPKTNSTWSERIIEIDPATSNIVWQWDTMDHIVQDADPTKPNYGVISENPSKVNANYYQYAIKPDWMHANSLDYNAKTGQIMMNVREFNEFWIINRDNVSTEQAKGTAGDLIYRWGNPAAYGQGTQQDRKLYLQHKAHWIADGLPGAGNVLIFNNGDKNRPTSNVLELSLPLQDKTYARDGQKFRDSAVVWDYDPRGKDQFFADIVSNAQRLPNGNTLIGAGTVGTATEVSASKKIVWKYISPYYDPSQMNPAQYVNMTFRFYKYPPGYSGFGGRL